MLGVQRAALPLMRAVCRGFVTVAFVTIAPQRLHAFAAVSVGDELMIQSTGAVRPVGARGWQQGHAALGEVLGEGNRRHLRRRN